MTLSVPSAFAAVTSLFIPPPAVADVAVAQLVPPLEVFEELDEHAAASNARAATPASASRGADLMCMPPARFPPPSGLALPASPGLAFCQEVDRLSRLGGGAPAKA